MKPNIVPVLQYDDAPAAIDWLVRAFGFTPNRGGVRFGPNPILIRPLAASTGAWSGVRHGLYVSAAGATEATRQDAESYVWSFGADDMGAGAGDVAVVPELRYRNFSAATAWLQSELGFETTFVVPGPDGTPSHAEMRLGEGTIFVGPRSTGGGAFGDISQFIDLVVDDPDSHHARAKAAGADVVIALRDTPFGARFYAVRDPERVLWWISSYRPAKPPDASR